MNIISDIGSMFSHQDKINDFEICREIGKGGFATVYEARRKSDGFLVACKMIDRKKIEQDNLTHCYPSYGNHRHVLSNSRIPSMFERLNAEITIHHQVKHRNIVELLTYFYDDKNVYLILEFCSRGDLEHYLKEKKTFCESETQNIVKQVVDGLVYLHNHGIIHRDIKLSNLLLTDNFQVKIADFGLAKKLQVTREQNNETMCGTPNYISPEIASRTPHSFATDVWSLGILTATLLIGRPPFDTDTVHGTLDKVTNEKYQLPTTFSEETQDFVNSTLQKTAELRPNIIEIRDHPFFSKDFSRLSQSNSYKCTWGPAVDRSHDSGFVENLTQHQRSTISTGSNSSSVTKGTYSARLYSPNPVSSPPPLNPAESIFKTTISQNKTNDYCLIQQQPIHFQQNSPFDISSKHNECIYSGTINLNEHRPTSATSSVRSQDSGVAQSDPKTSIDCSAKSELSQKVSVQNSDNRHLLNSKSTTMTLQRFPSTLKYQPQQIVDKTSEQIREKPQPLNAQRLKALRQATKIFIMNIMDNGEVVLEALRTKSTKRRITDVFRVSSDGLHIITYAPNSRHCSPTSDHPPPIPRDKNSYQEYTYDELPVEYWKKYQYAHKFVTLVRSRVPKIILYTQDAKCSLMETGIDFEAAFLCGVKITIYRENFKIDDPLKMKILNNDKSESLLDYDRVVAPNISAVEHFSPEIRQMIDDALLSYKFCLSNDKILEESQKQFPSIRIFPVQFGKKHGQSDINRSTTPCLISRTIMNKFDGSSSTINEPFVAPSSPILTNRLEFGSETDLRKSKNPPAIVNVGRNNIQHSISSSTLRTSGNYHQVTYIPQSSVLITNNHPRSHSVHPPLSYKSDSSNFNRPLTTNVNHSSSSSITTNNVGLTRKSITQCSNGTFRVLFSDDSVMIIREDSPDGQLFIDPQGKYYSFDRRQAHQPEAIQERLALFYQNEHDLVDYSNS